MPAPLDYTSRSRYNLPESLNSMLSDLPNRQPHAPCEAARWKLEFRIVFRSSDRYRCLCQNWNNRDCCQNTCDDCHCNDDFSFHRCSFPHFPSLIHALCNRSETYLSSFYARQCQKFFIWLNALCQKLSIPEQGIGGDRCWYILRGFFVGDVDCLKWDPVFLCRFLYLRHPIIGERALVGIIEDKTRFADFRMSGTIFESWLQSPQRWLSAR